MKTHVANHEASRMTTKPTEIKRIKRNNKRNADFLRAQALIDRVTAVHVAELNMAELNGYDEYVPPKRVKRTTAAAKGATKNVAKARQRTNGNEDDAKRSAEAEALLADKTYPVLLNEVVADEAQKMFDKSRDTTPNCICGMQTPPSNFHCPIHWNDPVFSAACAYEEIPEVECCFDDTPVEQFTGLKFNSY